MYLLNPPEILWYKKGGNRNKKRLPSYKKPIFGKIVTTWSQSATNCMKGRQPHEKDARIYR
jgi:hypothetical protein